MPPVLTAGTVNGVVTIQSTPLGTPPLVAQGVSSTPLPVPPVAETTHITTAPIQIPAAVVLVDVNVQVSLIPGPGTTALIMRLYKGAAAVAINVLATINFPLNVGPGSLVNATLHFVDQVGPGGQQLYTATVQQVGATGPGSITSSSLTAQIQQ
jgi:hypothetical protein